MLEVVDGVNRNGEEVDSDFYESEEESGSEVNESEEHSGILYPFVDEKKEPKEEKNIEQHNKPIEESSDESDESGESEIELPTKQKKL